eukprot:scaffold11785_cov19-Tisochrysis_lutea.AAC.1
MRGPSLLESAWRTHCNELELKDVGLSVHGGTHQNELELRNAAKQQYRMLLVITVDFPFCLSARDTSQ